MEAKFLREADEVFKSPKQFSACELATESEAIGKEYEGEKEKARIREASLDNSTDPSLTACVAAGVIEAKDAKKDLEVLCQKHETDSETNR